jgi:hypothetical protein
LQTRAGGWTGGIDLGHDGSFLVFFIVVQEHAQPGCFALRLRQRELHRVLTATALYNHGHATTPLAAKVSLKLARAAELPSVSGNDAVALPQSRLGSSGALLDAGNGQSLGLLIELNTEALTLASALCLGLIS